jgi:CubicO group peptidase (beta-lactamase class C family)
MNILRALIPGLLLLQVTSVSVANERAMIGVPPSTASQATQHNARQQPFSKWTFFNAGAPLNVVMIPRRGEIHRLPSDRKARDFSSLDTTFRNNDADALVVIKGNRLMHEAYFDDPDYRHQQHIWYSMTKSLVSSAFGILVEQGKVDVSKSPAHYIPELKGSGFERVTIQNVLDHDSALDFKETYTDFSSDFFLHYAPALNMAFLPGARDVQPGTTDIYGVHDFLAKFIQPDMQLQPGEAFDYNSSNADVLGWLVARISGENLSDYIADNIWAKIGAEHDAYIAVDRAFMPVATGGMNTTARDAARFGMLIRDHGKFDGKQVLSKSWTDEILNTEPRIMANMKSSPKYQDEPWQSYHNMWWILDAEKGEFCAVGIHGQVIYINRSTDTVMAWFSSQAVASSARNPVFHAKLNAARALSKTLN